MASLVYNLAKKQILDGTIDIDTDAAIKAMLVTSSYVANADDDFIEEGVDDANEHELTGTGYVAGFGNSGRKTLATKTVTEDDANDRAEFNADDLVWSGINAGTAAAVIIVKEITNDLASVLIAYIDTGGFPIVTNGGDLTVTWNVEGILQL